MSSPSQEPEPLAKDDAADDVIALDLEADDVEQTEVTAANGDIDEDLEKDVAEADSLLDARNSTSYTRQSDKAINKQNGSSDEVASSNGAHEPRPESPSGSIGSVPDDTPSIHGSLRSSPGSSILPSRARPGLGSPTPSLKPFDRRFQSRLSLSPSPRASSPAFLREHSRHASLSSSHFKLDGDDIETPSPPWEVVRWTKLKKLNGQAFTEAGRRNFGTPTCLSVSQNVVLGTSKGIILIFDYNQNLKSIIGLGTKAVESGAVTSIAISADHTTVAGGHANGSIFTWDTARSAKPFLEILPYPASQLPSRKVDAHISDFAVTHLGFLGTRHTALVSANDRGMAFSHLATRGAGALGRSVKTTRILGRYPDDTSKPPGKPRKPSTVLAFASLPLGNVERGVDHMGLTAMLTPYLLVIVSTTPIAQTQHKAARPKEVEAHSAMSGCLAWFPAVKLKVKDPVSGDMVSKVKLVYCWSNVLTVMDVDEVEASDKDKPPSLFFKARSRWKADEAIVAVQWISRSVLAVLTITQHLIILEDNTMRVTESFDLIGKHIYHRDLFSRQLHNLVEQLDEDDESMHGVVADAFYMSFKAYKGKMFLLGFNDVSFGSLSNWADRLVALMEEGDYIGAIHLANSYYTGDADKLTIGLPEDTTLRHSMVRDKLIEIMTASLRYAFGRQRKLESENESQLKELVEACFVACLDIGDTDFLFDEAFEWYEEGDAVGIFLEALEPYVLAKDITMIPPIVVKSLVTHYVSTGLESRLEEMICQMETATLDLNDLTTLCKQHNLYDALIYIWNQALGDYITPLIDLLTLLVPHAQNGDYFQNGGLEDPIFGVNALKMFPYLSYTFTGRRYPSGDIMSDQDAINAKSEIYWFLFSGKTIAWPKGSGKSFLTRGGRGEEPSYPYLRMILKFDASSFLSALNEGFEDPFLNNGPERDTDGGFDADLPEERRWGLREANRQHVVNVLRHVMTPDSFAPEDTIYLDMFIARNLPKFPQYLLLRDSALQEVLEGLCDYPSDDIADDAQLSAEYLMSVYHPSDVSSLIPLFKEAGFYRILKSIYRADHQYAELIDTYFEDHEDRHDVFTALIDCLGGRDAATKKQSEELQDVIKRHASDFLSLDTVETAKVIDAYAPDLHEHFLNSLGAQEDVEYVYLQTILEPGETKHTKANGGREKSLFERYIQLLCQFNSPHVVDYVNSIDAADLRLDKVLPAMEDTGVIDAAVVLMAREGQIRKAMDRLIKHLSKLEATLVGLLETEADIEVSQQEEAAEGLLEALQKYTDVGIWLCNGQSKTTRRATYNGRRSSSKEDLLPDELLWLDLIDCVVQITKSTSACLTNLSTTSSAQDTVDTTKLLTTLRTLVQRTFTALLTATSSPTRTSSPSQTQNLSFLRILRAFLSRASVSSPNLSDLRAVLASIFSAYAYEESILSLANRLLDKDLFINVHDANVLRQRGWRPKGSVCEGCKRRVWGPGAGGDVLGKWEERTAREERARRERMLDASDNGRGKGPATDEVVDADKSNGKGKAVADAVEEEDEGTDNAQQEEDLGPLVVMACRHIYHQVCLQKVQPVSVDEGDDGREFRCPIDG